MKALACTHLASSTVTFNPFSLANTIAVWKMRKQSHYVVTIVKCARGEGGVCAGFEGGGGGEYELVLVQKWFCILSPPPIAIIKLCEVQKYFYVLPPAHGNFSLLTISKLFISPTRDNPTPLPSTHFLW